MNKLISFEGVDGSGKTTQIKLFLKKLEKHRIKYEFYREPGGTKLSEKIRELLLDKENNIDSLTETMLFCSARSQLVSNKILPLINNNNYFIVCDRFIDSTVAYQAYGRGIDVDLINFLNSVVTSDILPSTTFLLDCDMETSLKRMSKNDRMEAMGNEFLEKVKLGYQKISKKNSDRILLIDTNNSIDNISKEIWKYFCQRYNYEL